MGGSLYSVQEVGSMLSGSTKSAAVAMAVGCLAAFIVSCAFIVPASAAVVSDEKTRNKASKALRSGEFELAEKIFREMLLKNGQDNEARLGLSLALLKQRDYQG